MVVSDWLLNVMVRTVSVAAPRVPAADASAGPLLALTAVAAALLAVGVVGFGRRDVPA